MHRKRLTIDAWERYLAALIKGTARRDVQRKSGKDIVAAKIASAEASKQL
jgi:hypothetical protein